MKLVVDVHGLMKFKVFKNIQICRSVKLTVKKIEVG